MKTYICILLAWLIASPAFAIEKNVASQYLELQAIDSATGAPKTGDAANLTAYVSGDGDTTPDALGDTSATEISSTNAPGVYRFDLTQAETNFTNILFSGKSSTSGVYLVPRMIWTVPSGFATLTIANNATAANVTRWSGTAVVTPRIAGFPEVAPPVMTWYVDDTDGTGDIGSYDAPFDTYAAAESAAHAGDIIHLRAGTYPAISITKRVIVQGDSSAASIVSTSSANRAIDIQASGVVVHSIKAVNSASGGVGIGAPDVHNTDIYGCDVTGVTYGIYAPSGVAPKIHGNLITAKSIGIMCYGSQGHDVYDNYIVLDGSEATSQMTIGIRAVSSNVGRVAYNSVNITRTNAASADTIGIATSYDPLAPFSACDIDTNSINVSLTNASATGKAYGIKGDGDDPTLLKPVLATLRGNTFNLAHAAGNTKIVHIEASTSGTLINDLGGNNYDVSLCNGTSNIRSMVASTVPRRTLDITTTGAAGIDLANVESPTTTLNLSGTTISTSQQVASVTGAVGSVAAGGITASSIATDAIGAAEVAASAATEIGSAASAVTGSDLATEGINSNLIFTLNPGSNGPRSDTKSIIKGSPAATYAVDFKNVAAVNQKILTVDSIEIVSGTSGGITFNDDSEWARDGGTQARFRMAGVTAGTYVVRVQVTYNTGPSQRGDIVVKVVD